MKQQGKRRRMVLTAIALCLGLLVVVSQTVVPASAQKPTPIPTQSSDTLMALVPSKDVVAPGEEFDLSVVITINSDTPSRAAQCALNFDPQVVEVLSVEEGGFYKDWATGHGGDTVVMPSKPQIDNKAGLVGMMGVAILGGEESGPTGSGQLFTYRVKVKKGAKGQTTFSLSEVLVTDSGNNELKQPQPLGGVRTQDAVISIGGEAAPEQPTAQAVEAGAPQAQPTVARRAAAETEEDAGGGSIPWIIILPVVGAVLVGAVVFFTTRKR